MRHGKIIRGRYKLDAFISFTLLLTLPFLDHKEKNSLVSLSIAECRNCIRFLPLDLKQTHFGYFAEMKHFYRTKGGGESGKPLNAFQKNYIITGKLKHLLCNDRMEHF